MAVMTGSPPPGTLRAGEYQYGVMFQDGSVARSWNGNTQEKRAQEYAARCRAEYPRDDFHVVRRLIGPWEVVNADA